MTIHDEQAENDKARQEESRRAIEDKQAAARPDAMHRAIIFLLKEAKLMNRDATREADRHITALDDALGTDPAKVEEAEAAASATVAPIPTKTNTSGPAQPPATPTADGLRTSQRFKRNGGKL